MNNGDTVQYRVNVHHEDDGTYWAEVDELPGCFASGDTLDELWESLTDSIGAYLTDESQTVQVKMQDAAFVSSSESQAVDARVLLCS